MSEIQSAEEFAKKLEDEAINGKTQNGMIELIRARDKAWVERVETMILDYLSTYEDDGPEMSGCARIFNSVLRELGGEQ